MSDIFSIIGAVIVGIAAAIGGLFTPMHASNVIEHQFDKAFAAVDNITYNSSSDGYKSIGSSHYITVNNPNQEKSDASVSTTVYPDLGEIKSGTFLDVFEDLYVITMHQSDHPIIRRTNHPVKIPEFKGGFVYSHYFVDVDGQLIPYGDFVKSNPNAVLQVKSGNTLPLYLARYENVNRYPVKPPLSADKVKKFIDVCIQNLGDSTQEDNIKMFFVCGLLQSYMAQDPVYCEQTKFLVADVTDFSKDLVQHLDLSKLSCPSFGHLLAYTAGDEVVFEECKDKDNCIRGSFIKIN